MIETGPLVPKGKARAQATRSIQGTALDSVLVQSDIARGIALDTERAFEARFARCGAARSRLDYVQYHIRPVSLVPFLKAATNQETNDL